MMNEFFNTLHIFPKCSHAHAQLKTLFPFSLRIIFFFFSLKIFTNSYLAPHLLRYYNLVPSVLPLICAMDELPMLLSKTPISSHILKDTILAILQSFAYINFSFSTGLLLSTYYHTIIYPILKTLA